jgi:predicted nucleic acid-binding protein
VTLSLDTSSVIKLYVPEAGAKARAAIVKK